MPRHSYKLSVETIKVLSDRVEAVANEMCVRPQAIYNILEQRETDAFAKMKVLAPAAVRAGCDIGPWISWLQSIQIQEPKRLPVRLVAGQYSKETNDVGVAVIEGRSLEEQLTEVQQ